MLLMIAIGWMVASLGNVLNSMQGCYRGRTDWLGLSTNSLSDSALYVGADLVGVEALKARCEDGDEGNRGPVPSDKHLVMWELRQAAPPSYRL
jgi:hypothetical protein